VTVCTFAVQVVYMGRMCVYMCFTCYVHQKLHQLTTASVAQDQVGEVTLITATYSAYAAARNLHKVCLMFVFKLLCFSACRFNSGR
jgi:hypothetical protein